MSGRVALVTGATQGLGLALVAGLAARLDPDDVVYLTGRSEQRVAAAVGSCAAGGATVRGALLDVADPQDAQRVADAVRADHGGVDIVVNNAVMRVGPDDDARAIVGEYAEVNNFGTTRTMRAFAPLLRDRGRFVVVASSLGTLAYLAPVLHHRFDGLGDLDAVDDAVRAWRDGVADGSARGGPWPGFVNIPSKIGQVAAVRALAAHRRAADLARGITICAVCPGMINTPTSGMWWDVSDAPTPEQAAAPLVDLLLGPTRPRHYGELVRDGEPLPWHPVAPDRTHSTH